jgi:hypothetical protein
MRGSERSPSGVGFYRQNVLACFEAVRSSRLKPVARSDERNARFC